MLSGDKITWQENGVVRAGVGVQRIHLEHKVGRWFEKKDILALCHVNLEMMLRKKKKSQFNIQGTTDRKSLSTLDRTDVCMHPLSATFQLILTNCLDFLLGETGIILTLSRDLKNAIILSLPTGQDCFFTHPTPNLKEVNTQLILSSDEKL